MKLSSRNEYRIYFTIILFLIFLASILLKPEENYIVKFSNNIYIQQDTSYLKLKKAFWDKDKNIISSNQGTIAKAISSDIKTFNEFDLLEYEFNDPQNINSLLINNSVNTNSSSFYWEISLYLFFVLFLIYGILYFPSDYRYLRDMKRNYNLVPFSYLSEKERYNKLKERLYCKVCNSKIPQYILKEEFIQGMQFVTFECDSCNHQIKERLL